MGGMALLMAVAPNPNFTGEAQVVAGLAFGGLAARALWSAGVSYRAAPLELGTTVNARGRIAVFSSGERSASLGAAVTIGSSGFVVLTFPPGAPLTGDRWAIALLLYALGALLAWGLFMLARERRAGAVAAARARLPAGESLKTAERR